MPAPLGLSVVIVAAVVVAACSGGERPRPDAAPRSAPEPAVEAGGHAESRRVVRATALQESAVSPEPAAAPDEDGVTGDVEAVESVEPQPAVRLRVVAAPIAGGAPQPVIGARAHASAGTPAGGTDGEDGAADGMQVVRSDAEGVVVLPAGVERVHVVAAGYWPLRDQPIAGGVVELRPIDVRAVHLPYEQLWEPRSLEWALELARGGLITAIVVDIKEEGGAVLPAFATEAVQAIEATVDPGTDVAGFLEELGELGVYRIARQAVFLDTRLGRSDVETAILTRGGEQLIDDLGLGWTTPQSAKARRYNIEIALAAAVTFEEIQFDYVRFPVGPLRVHEETTGAERSAAVALFVQEASAALHAVGAAVSVDTFGETAVITGEDSIGQVLEALTPYVDYYSPMVYPSTWGAGWFGLEYPAADPFAVVSLSVRRALERIAAAGLTGVAVRPWLQDYQDYGPRQISYGYAEVLAQIQASMEAGGLGFMLWDPTLRYREDVLGLFAGAD